MRQLSLECIGFSVFLVLFSVCMLLRSFKRNLAIARNEMKPGSFSIQLDNIPSLVYESMGYVNSGSSFRFSGGLRARAL